MSNIEEISTYHLVSDDFEEIRAGDVNWDHELNQLEPGPFQGELLGLDVGPLEITYNKWGRKVHYRGVPPAGAIAVIITTNQSGECVWMGEPVIEGDIFIQCADKEAELFTPSYWDSFVLVIPESMLAAYLSDFSCDNSDEIMRSHSIHSFRHDQISSLQSAGRAILSTAAGLNSKRDANPHLKKMAESIVEMTALTLTESKQKQSKSKICRLLDRRGQIVLVRKAQEYCLENPAQKLRISSLCRELKINERTLRHAFHNSIKISPLAFLKMIKLNRVYKKLRESDYSQTLIKQVAYEYGFFHLSQFSQDYKRVFGELPSQTLVSKQPSKIYKQQLGLYL